MTVTINVRLHQMFYVNNLRPCPTATLRPSRHVTSLDDDAESDVANVTNVKIDAPLARRGECLLSHLKDEQIPLVWHRLILRTTYCGASTILRPT
jgi:hypothetical protein